MSNLKDALRLLEEKQFQKARDILEELHEGNPEDVDILYNLGMCYTEVNEPGSKRGRFYFLIDKEPTVPNL